MHVYNSVNTVVLSYEMKKIWKSFLRSVKNRNYQQKAIKYAEDMEKTGVRYRMIG